MSRKFKKGDIVWYRNTFFHVVRDEDDGAVSIAENGADAQGHYIVSPDKLKLVCAVEDSEGGSAAGEPGSVSRRRGNLGTAEIGGEV